jgi:hypothetical protein
MRRDQVSEQALGSSLIGRLSRRVKTAVFAALCLPIEKKWKELFENHGDRILGTFETPDKAEAFLDMLRDIRSPSPSLPC